jgi:DNA-binding NarL/FixJ family response regulator
VEQERKAGRKFGGHGMQQPAGRAGDPANDCSPFAAQTVALQIPGAIRPLADPLAPFIERFARRYRLSPHQTAVVTFAAAGLCRKESADQMACSLKTVDEHWRRVYDKAGCASAPQVVAKLLLFALTEPT